MIDEDDDGIDGFNGALAIDLGDNENGTSTMALVNEKGIHIGEARRVKDGDPLPDDGGYFLRTEKGVVVDGYKLKGGEGKPAQVASPSYRANYEAIFGTKKTKQELN